AAVGGRGEHATAKARDDLVLVVSDGRTALRVEQHVVEGIADLTREQPERIDLGAIAIRREHVTDIVASEIGPVALRFHAGHHGAHLPAIADLSTERAARSVMATL